MNCPLVTISDQDLALMIQLLSGQLATVEDGRDLQQLESELDRRFMATMKEISEIDSAAREVRNAGLPAGTA